MTLIRAWRLSDAGRSPDIGRHSLQIEINRALGMNEDTFERTPYYATPATHLGQLIETFIRLRPEGWGEGGGVGRQFRRSDKRLLCPH